jgi:rfaE bifunctional protein nucleotidyltransferase chain/domain
MKTLDKIKSKIISTDEISSLKKVLSDAGKSIVFTNGCFDIIHRGHIEYLATASDLADVMILGLNTDISVSRIKGEGRPLQDQISRSLTLAALAFIDYVVLFDEETPYELIKLIVPDVLVKGSDYKIEEIVGHDIVLASGGRVETIDFIPGYSTTEILRRGGLRGA